MRDLKPAIIIPARYESSRFPGKPLTKIAGKTLIERTYEQCAKSVVPHKDIWVATDHEGISIVCKTLGINVMHTTSGCATGTDRVHEVARNPQFEDIDFFVNVQGDEPLIDPLDINKVIKVADEEWPRIVARCEDGNFRIVPHRPPVLNAFCDIESEVDFHNPNIPKVVIRSNSESGTTMHELLYASRAGIPTTKRLGYSKAYRQVCIYAFTREHLKAFAYSSKTSLEHVEDIEILRFLELGIRVQMVRVSESSISVDVPADVAWVEKALQERGLA